MNTLELIIFVLMPLLVTSIAKALFMKVFEFRSKDERRLIVCANIVSLIATSVIAVLLTLYTDESGPVPLIIGGFLLVCGFEWLIYGIAFGKVERLPLKILLSNLVAAAILALFFILMYFLLFLL